MEGLASIVTQMEVRGHGMHAAFQNRWLTVAWARVVSKYTQGLMLYAFDGRSVAYDSIVCYIMMRMIHYCKVQINYGLIR